MDELTAINKIVVNLGISSRTLRYWEQAGLFKSTRDPQSGWRLYDDYALQCIRVTNLLRRLDFSISEIKAVIEKRSLEALRQVLQKQISRLDQTNAELDARREVISGLLKMLETEPAMDLSALENILLPVALERKKHVVSPSLFQNQGGFQMEKMKSNQDSVQLIKMAPARAIAYSVVDTEPESKASEPVIQWIRDNKLAGTMRLFGFNTDPYPSGENSAYGFGYCATIPEGIEIPAPFYEMNLPGGVYAVVSDYEGDPSFGWRKVQALMQDSEWEWKYDDTRHPGLEEHIEQADGKGYLIPILVPVKRK